MVWVDHRCVDSLQLDAVFCGPDLLCRPLHLVAIVDWIVAFRYFSLRKTQTLHPNIVDIIIVVIHGGIGKHYAMESKFVAR